MKTGQERPLVATDVVRRRPEMYLGGCRIEYLVRAAVDVLFPAPVKPPRLVLWAGDVYTVAFDGPPLSVGPAEDGACMFERCFTRTGGPGPCHAFVVNGASARLDAWTLHGSTAYLCGFERGHRWLATRAAPQPLHARFGANGFTFRPDRSFITGDLSVEALVRARNEAAARGAAQPPVEVVNRMTEPCEWPLEVV
jgi:hypothetical protein